MSDDLTYDLMSKMLRVAATKVFRVIYNLVLKII